MFKPFVRTVLAASLLVFLAACEQKPADSTAPASVAVSADTPDGAIRKSAALLKQGDVAGFMQNAMPAAEFDKVKADWTRDANAKPITEEDRQKFAETMAKLTAPDAEQTLFAEIEPQLKAFDAQYQQQIPMYVAMGSSWLQGMVQQNKEMSEDSKQQALAAINALGGWVQKTRFTDPEAIKKILAIASKSARDINLQTLDEARALTFDQSMQKARIALLGLKGALGVYGFSLDQMLDSIQPEVLSNDGKTAQVKVSYTLLDTPLNTVTEMVNLDGHWYGKEAMEKLSEHASDDAEDAADADAAPAPGN